MSSPSRDDEGEETSRGFLCDPLFPHSDHCFHPTLPLLLGLAAVIRHHDFSIVIIWLFHQLATMEPARCLSGNAGGRLQQEAAWWS